MPGHAGGLHLAPAFRVAVQDPWDLDFTELDGLDNLASPAGVIRQSQDQVAAWLGVARTFYLVQGSTGGLHALLRAVAAEGEAIAFPRSSHLAIWQGCALAGIRPVVLDTPWDDERALPELPQAATFAARLRMERAEGGLKAIVLTRPDYHGRCLDLGPWAELARELGVWLLVDEAHGSHLGICPGMPAGAIAGGAHAVVQSIHKTLGAFTQAAALHLAHEGPDPERVQRVLRAITTTSPSYLLLASLEAAFVHHALHGARSWARLVEDVRRCREQLARAGIPCLDDGGPGIALDPTRLVVDAFRWGRAPEAVAERLSGRGLELELVTDRYLGALLTPAHQASDLDRLVQELRAIAAEIPAGPVLGGEAPGSAPPRAMPLGTAWQESGEVRPLAGCLGRVSVEFVAPYPPGLPLLTPGEVVTPSVLEELELRREGGAAFVGPADPSLETLRTCSRPS